MHCLTAWGQWTVQLLQCTSPLPGGSGQCNFCNTLPHCLGAVGSATPAMQCLTALGQWASELLQRTASLPGSSGQCNSCNALPHCLGAVGSATPAMGGRSVVPGLWGCTTGRIGLGGWGVQPREWSGHPSGPMGGHHLRRAGRTGLGGTGSPAQGVVGTSCKAHGEPSSSNNGAYRFGGDGESSPGGGRSPLQGQWGAIIFGEPGALAWGGGRESSPGGGRGILQGQWGAIIFQQPGVPVWGGRGVQPRGCSEPPARPTGGHLLQRTGRTGLGGTGSPAQGVFGASRQADGGPISSENRAHRPGGDGESCPGGVRSLLQGPWGANIFREPGAPARGGRGVLPGGCSESPARPRGGHLLQRTGRTGPGGTGSPAQGVFGVSCQGQWGANIFREPGAPAWGGRGVQPRGCSEPPARPVGGQYLRRTGRTGLGGTGSPAQGVFGASGRTRGYSLLPLSSSRQVSRQYRGS